MVCLVVLLYVQKNHQKGILTAEEIKMLEEGKINELVNHQVT